MLSFQNFIQRLKVRTCLLLILSSTLLKLLHGSFHLHGQALRYSIHRLKSENHLVHHNISSAVEKCCSRWRTKIAVQRSYLGLHPQSQKLEPPSTTWDYIAIHLRLEMVSRTTSLKYIYMKMATKIRKLNKFMWTSVSLSIG